MCVCVGGGGGGGGVAFLNHGHVMLVGICVTLSVFLAIVHRDSWRSRTFCVSVCLCVCVLDHKPQLFYFSVVLSVTDLDL